MQRYFTIIILVAMALGIGVGAAIHNQVADPETIKAIAGNFSVITDIFLRLIKMIIAPLVFSTLVVGVAHLGDGQALGRIGAKTMAWFIMASILSLTLGAIMVSLLKPGVGLNLPLPDAGASAGIKAGAINLKDFITHLVPKSIVEAMATNEILQIVVFSLFVGAACVAMKEQAKPVVELAESISHVMLKITGYVMMTAPLAVFAAMAATVSSKGLAILTTYAAFIGGFYAALGALWALLIALGFLILGIRVFQVIAAVREPTLLAFSTASSEAAYPKTLEALVQVGASRRITSFVLPLGYSFNLDGSMMYCTFAVIFLAQAYGVPLSILQIATMLGILMVTSKGMAGVPRASLVVIAATLPQFGIPEAGLLLILAVDHFLDMGRSATNVVGNSIATAVVAKWEGELAKAGAQPEGSGAFALNEEMAAAPAPSPPKNL